MEEGIRLRWIVLCCRTKVPTRGPITYLEHVMRTGQWAITPEAATLAQKLRDRGGQSQGEVRRTRAPGSESALEDAVLSLIHDGVECMPSVEEQIGETRCSQVAVMRGPKFGS